MFFDLFYWKKSYLCNRFHHRAMDDVFNEIKECGLLLKWLENKDI